MTPPEIVRPTASDTSVLDATIAFLATADAARSRAFYEGTLGLRFVSDDRHALVFDARGTALRIQKTADVVVAPYTALGWAVSDMDAAVEMLSERGVRFTRYDFLTQDERGVWTTPDGARVAWFRDPDGHTLSLTQLPPG